MGGRGGRGGRGGMMGGPIRGPAGGFGGPRPNFDVPPPMKIGENAWRPPARIDPTKVEDPEVRLGWGWGWGWPPAPVATAVPWAVYGLARTRASWAAMQRLCKTIACCAWLFFPMVCLCAIVLQSAVSRAVLHCAACCPKSPIVLPCLIGARPVRGLWQPWLPGLGWHRWAARYSSTMGGLWE
jgi:hypothetical protein